MWPVKSLYLHRVHIDCGVVQIWRYYRATTGEAIVFCSEMFPLAQNQGKIFFLVSKLEQGMSFVRRHRVPLSEAATTPREPCVVSPTIEILAAKEPA